MQISGFQSSRGLINAGLLLQADPSVAETPEKHSLLPLPNPAIVAGDRFRETYYWDSFFIIRGLLVSGMSKTAMASPSICFDTLHASQSAATVKKAKAQSGKQPLRDKQTLKLLLQRIVLPHPFGSLPLCKETMVSKLNLTMQDPTWLPLSPLESRKESWQSRFSKLESSVLPCKCRMSSKIWRICWKRMALSPMALGHTTWIAGLALTQPLSLRLQCQENPPKVLSWSFKRSMADSAHQMLAFTSCLLQLLASLPRDEDKRGEALKELTL